MANEIENWKEEIEWLRGLARRLVSDPSLAEDLAQETAVLYLEQARDLGPLARRWRAGVLRRLVYTRWRSEARRKTRERESDPPRNEIEPEEILEQVEAQHALTAAVIGLPEAYREVILLRYYQDLSPSEVAARLDEPVGRVRTRLSRAVEKLRTILDRDHGGNRAAWLSPLAAWVGLSWGDDGSLWAADSRPAPAPQRSSPTLVSGLVVVVLAGLALWFATWGGALPGSDRRQVADPSERTGPARTDAEDRFQVADQLSPNQEAAGTRAANPHRDSPRDRTGARQNVPSQKLLIAVQDEHGNAIPEASVELDDFESVATTETGPLGNASFPLPIRDSVVVTATAEGYMPRIVRLDAPQSTKAAVITLAPAAEWFVEVVDYRGDPVEGAKVAAQGVTHGEQVSALTDALGRARLSPLPIEGIEYWVSGFEQLSTQGAVEAPVDLPPIIELETESRLMIRASFPVPPGRDQQVRVLLSNQDRTQSRFDYFPHEVWSDGVMEIALAPGSYWARVEITGYGDHEERIVVGNDEEIWIEYSPAVDRLEYEIEVIGRHGSPVEGEVGVIVRHFSPVWTPIPKELGERIRGSVPHRVKSMTIHVRQPGGVTHIEEAVDPRQSPIVVTLPELGRLDVQVNDSDGSPFEGIEVTVRRENVGGGIIAGQSWEERESRLTSRAGTLSIGDLSPGSYRVSLLLGDATLHSRVVQVDPAKVLVEQFTLPTCFTIRGSVFRNGHPVSGGRVRLSAAGRGFTFEVGEDGEFSGLACEMEAASLSYRSPDFEVSFPTRSIQPEGTLVLEFPTIDGEIHLIDEGGRSVGPVILKVNSIESLYSTASVAIDRDGVGVFQHLIPGESRVIANFEAALLLRSPRVTLRAGVNRLVVIDGDELQIHHDLEAGPIGLFLVSNGVWRKCPLRHRSLARSHFTVPRERGTRVLVAELPGKSAQLLVFPRGLPELPLQLEAKPGGTISIPEWPGGEGATERLIIESRGEPLPEPLQWRSWSGRPVTIHTPPGEFEIRAERDGDDGAVVLGARTVTVVTGETAVLEWE